MQLQLHLLLDLLHVDLDNADSKTILYVFGRQADVIKDGIYHSRNDSLMDLVHNIGPLHGVSLARRSLSVGEDGAVEAFKHTGDDWFGGIVEYVLLGAVSGEYPVQSEVVIIFSRLLHIDALLIRVLQTSRVLSS